MQVWLFDLTNYIPTLVGWLSGWLAGWLAVIDFGGATYDDRHKTRVVCTRQYRPPEVVLGAGWSFPADVWSLGCIVAEIASGDLLFNTVC